MRTKIAAMIVVPPCAAVLVTAFCLLGYALQRVFGLPLRVGIPWAVRIGGGVVLSAGFALLLWLFRYRRPADVLVSTYISITKFARRASLQAPAGGWSIWWSWGRIATSATPSTRP